MRGVVGRLALAAALGAALPAAAQPEPGQAAAAREPAEPEAPPFEREDVRAVAERIACYCGCPHMQVSACFCGTADSVRQEIAGRLDAGEGPDAIVAAYLAEHGDWALIVPPRRGYNLSIWVLPVVIIVLGALLLIVLGRRWSRSAAGAGEHQEPVLDEGERDRVDALLRDLD